MLSRGSLFRGGGGGGHSLGLLIPVWPAGITNLLGSDHHWLCVESSAHNGGRTKPAHAWKAFYYVTYPCSVMRITCSSRLTVGWSGQEYSSSAIRRHRTAYFKVMQRGKLWLCRHFFLFGEKKIYKVIIYFFCLFSKPLFTIETMYLWIFFVPAALYSKITWF